MDPIVARAIERLIIVLIGGLAVYFGYRLFLALPSEKDSQGKVVLPGGISVMFSRVGPGVFFALFGAAVVVASLHYQLQLPGSAAPQSDVEAQPEPAVALRYVGESKLGEAAALQSRRQAILKALRDGRKAAEALGQYGATLSGHARVQAERDKQALESALRILASEAFLSVWADDLGERAAFAGWAVRGDPPPATSGEDAQLFFTQAEHILGP